MQLRLILHLLSRYIELEECRETLPPRTCLFLVSGQHDHNIRVCKNKPVLTHLSV